MEQPRPPTSREAELLDELRRRLERDYVSVGEMAIWLVGVVLVLVGLHFFLVFWARDFFRGSPPAESGAPRLVDQETAVVWYGSYGPGGYALLRLPADSPEAAAFRDEALSRALGRKVRSYWLSLYSFGRRTPGFALDLGRQRLSARVGGQTLQSIAPPDELPPGLAAQMAPLEVAPGHHTRCLVLFPAHDAGKLEQLDLPLDGRTVRLARAERPTKALAVFLEAPTRRFFETAHGQSNNHKKK